MTSRLFRCKSCSHRLRFGARHCGKCYRPTQMYNWRLPYWLVVLAIPVVGLVIIAS